jgi:hypothetical protein
MDQVEEVDRKTSTKVRAHNLWNRNVVYCGSPFPLYKRLPTGPANCDCGPSLDSDGDPAGPAGPLLTFPVDRIDYFECGPQIFL